MRNNYLLAWSGLDAGDLVGTGGGGVPGVTGDALFSSSGFVSGEGRGGEGREWEGEGGEGEGGEGRGGEGREWEGRRRGGGRGRGKGGGGKGRRNKELFPPPHHFHTWILSLLEHLKEFTHLVFGFCLRASLGNSDRSSLLVAIGGLPIKTVCGHKFTKSTSRLLSGSLYSLDWTTGLDFDRLTRVQINGVRINEGPL